MNAKSALGGSLSPANKLYQDVEIEGTLTFSDTLEFEGTLKGSVLASGTFIVGKHGKIEGSIKTDSLVVLGAVDGNAEILNNCVLKSSCDMKGDITSSLISMEEGAKYTGKFTINRSA